MIVVRPDDDALAGERRIAPGEDRGDVRGLGPLVPDLPAGADADRRLEPLEVPALEGGAQARLGEPIRDPGGRLSPAGGARAAPLAGGIGEPLDLAPRARGVEGGLGGGVGREARPAGGEGEQRENRTRGGSHAPSS